MRTTDTKKSTKQMPVGKTPRKCGFGSEEIRKVMFEDINRGATFDESMVSRLIHDKNDEPRRNPDF